MMGHRFFLGCLLFPCVLGVRTEDQPEKGSFRDKRLFSLFNIVTFPNGPCSTLTSNLKGTCMTATECSAKSGSSSGNCAAGFGVCCLFIATGDCASAKTINQNCTYIQSNGFPAADTTVSQTCKYNFNRICQNLCQIRLDFQSLSTLAGTTGACGTAADAITVTSPFSSSANAFPPTVCGTLTGQHMYLETGTSGSAGTLSIAKGTGAGSRSFQIKATYYTCDNLAKAPAGCTQYFTGTSGNIKSYNFGGGQLLQAQNYNNCIRQAEGFCTFQVQESGTIPDPFLLSATPTETKVVCQGLSYIVVTTPTLSMFCGGVLSNVLDNTTPGAVTSAPGSAFQVGVNTVKTTLAGFSGFNLDYTQVPCA